MQPTTEPTGAVLAPFNERTPFQTVNASVSAVGGGVRISVADSTKPARVSLNAGDTAWNLSGRTLVASVHNGSENPLVIRLRVENDGAQGLMDACEIPAPLAAGETRDVSPSNCLPSRRSNIRAVQAVHDVLQEHQRPRQHRRSARRHAF